MHMSSLAPNNSAQEYLRIEPHLNWAISNARSRKLPQHLADQTKPVTITLTSQHLHTAWIFTNLRQTQTFSPRLSAPSAHQQYLAFTTKRNKHDLTSCLFRSWFWYQLQHSSTGCSTRIHKFCVSHCNSIFAGSVLAHNQEVSLSRSFPLYRT